MGTGPKARLRFCSHEVQARLGDLTKPQLRKVRDYERRHGNRKSVLGAIEKKLA